jgi:hypothetical protein
MKLSLLMMSALMLIGCQPKSEVDNCVEAIHKRNEPYDNADERKEVEVLARFHCMKLQSGAK